MATNTVNITAHFAKEIRDLKLRTGLMSPYLTFTVIGNQYRSESKKTNPHIHGGANPSWENQIELELPQDAMKNRNSYNLICEINHHSKICDRRIGKVTIPLDIVLVTRERVHYVVMTTSSKAQGWLILSHCQTTSVAAGDHDVAIHVAADAPTAPPPTPVNNGIKPYARFGFIANVTIIAVNLMNMFSNIFGFY